MNNCMVSIKMGNEVVISVPVEANGPVVDKATAYGLAMLKVYDTNPQLSTLLNKLNPPARSLFNGDTVTIR